MSASQLSARVSSASSVNGGIRGVGATLKRPKGSGGGESDDAPPGMTLTANAAKTDRRGESSN